MHIIVDIDGTLANNGQRAAESMCPKTGKLIRKKFFESKSIMGDKPYLGVISHLWQKYLMGFSLVFSTGRSGNTRKITEDWLEKYINFGMTPFRLYMNEHNMKSVNAKIHSLSMMHNDILGFNPVCAIDDCFECLEMYYKQGIGIAHPQFFDQTVRRYVNDKDVKESIS